MVCGPKGYDYLFFNGNTIIALLIKKWKDGRCP